MGKMLLKNMNRNVNPCDDFYTFVCGNWEKNNPIPSTVGEWSVHSVIKRKNDEKKKELLLSTLQESIDGVIYKLCLNKPYLAKSRPSVIKAYMKSSKYWPMILNKDEAKSLYQPWWKIDNYYIQLTGESALFDSELIPNFKHGGPPIQNLYDLISPYGSLLQLEQWDRKSILAYKQFLLRLIKIVSPSKINEAYVWNSVNKVIKFRCKLKKIIQFSNDKDVRNVEDDNVEDDVIDQSNGPDPEPIRQFQQWYDNLTHSKKSLMINWLEMIRSLYGPADSVKVNSDTIINVSRKKYFSLLIELLEEVSEETIVNHIQLYFLERYMQLDVELKDTLLKATVQNFEVTSRIRYIPERWKSCLDKIGNNWALSDAYVNAVFKPKNIKEKVERLFINLKDVIKEQIAESAWLNSDIKHESTMKIMYTRVWCGYPVWYDKPSSRRRYLNVDMDPTEVNACLELNRNLVLISAGILRYPVYSKALPDIMNYASTGTLIAHEIYHTFSDTGLYYNEKGEYSLTYWPANMLMMYSQRRRCFVNQYNNYDIMELHRTENPLKCNGELTYDENLSDVMGLKAAFKLYTKKKETDLNFCQVLPGFEKFSCDQFFFLSFASSLCGAISKEFLQCVHMANVFLRNINPNVHPCDDFYAYACGNWEKYNPPPDDAVDWTVYTVMGKRTDLLTKELLLTLLQNTNYGQVYRRCLEKPYLTKSKPSVIKSCVKGSRYWPMILNKEEAKMLYQPWWTIDNYYIQLTGESALFSTELILNFQPDGPPMQNLYELMSAYGSLYRYREWDLESMANYKRFLMKLVLMVAPCEVEVAYIFEDLENVMRFRSKLEKIIADAQEDDLLKINPRSIKQFQKWYDNYRKKSATVNWLEIIRSFYGPKQGPKINDDTVINVERFRYFYLLIDLIEGESEETVVNHIQLYFVERYTELNSRLKGILLKTTHKDMEQTAEIRHVSERWKSCLDKLSSDSDIAMAYVDAVFKPKNIKDQVEKIFSKMKDIVKMQISKSTWLDPYMTKKSLDKITKTKLWCGYPEWYDKFPLKNKYRNVFMNPLIVNAFFVLDHNLVLINAAILEYPVYSKYFPYIMNYATLGTLIAHELYHGFDKKGVFYNAEGKYVKTFWSKKMMNLYDERKQCFIDQYESYNITDLENTQKSLQCDDLIEEVSEETIVNHIQLYFMERYVKLDSSLKSILLKTTVHNFEPTGAIRHVSERWKSCLDQLSTDFDTVTAYIDAVFKPKNIKDEVEKLFSNIKDVIKMQISKSTWLDPNTMKKSIDKVTKTKLWCGYPEWFDEFSLKNKHRDVQMNPMAVNAYLMLNRNLVLINAAILEYPMYSKYFPYIMNYATLGTLIAHELHHGFDEKGVVHNADGKHVKTFWSKKMLKLYDNKKQCFVNQYDKYGITELGNTPRPLKCDGELTYNENLADIMGLKAAFALYKEKKLKKNGACTVLVGFEKFSCDKLFFLSFANTLCGVISKEFLHLIEEESEVTVVNHIQLYFVERYTELDSRLKGMLLKTTVQNSEPTGEIRHISERWELCLDELDTDYEMATAYVDAVFKPKNIKGEVERLFSKMKDIVKMQISESTWLDSHSKERSIDKVTKTKLWCGYPEWFDKFPLKQKHRDIEMNPTAVNAHLVPRHNLVLVNAAILEYPIYSKYFPYVMNYATLGTMMAHELYHGFDEKAEGKHVEAFWSKKMLRLYNARKQCFVDQYDSYDITELGNTRRPLKCDGELTYKENLADRALRNIPATNSFFCHLQIICAA
ncbi:hypothetical protein KM043_015077 [Ampulex compressa]|nr:hypothetical protein KM043_015077 [Ampulex compressa]